MAALVPQSVQDYHDFLIVNASDARALNYPLTRTPWPGLFLLGLYLYFSLEFGPRLMKNRPPLNVDRFMIAYNIFQVVYNVILFSVVLARCFTIREGSILCAPILAYDTTFSTLDFNITYAYFILKLIDWLDTIFMVLRKKNTQISFLHIYHHVGIFVASWFAAKYFPGGTGGFLALLNTFVHSLMYMYYLCSNLKVERVMRYKQHVTLLQMVQFGVLLAHSLQLWLFQSCNYPIRAYTLLVVPQYGVMLYLFTQFYIQVYIKQGKTSEKPINVPSTSKGKAHINGQAQSQTSKKVD